MVGVSFGCYHEVGLGHMDGDMLVYNLFLVDGMPWCNFVLIRWFGLVCFKGWMLFWSWSQASTVVIFGLGDLFISSQIWLHWS